MSTETKLDVAALRALLAKATRGPWAANGKTVENLATIAFCGESSAAHVDGRHRHINADEAKGNAALIVAAVNALPALLDAADPETLRFVLHKPSGVYRALAADAAFYELRPEYSGRGTVMERQDGYALVVPNERAWTHYPSLDSVIEAAREHDRRRRGAK